MPNPRPTTENCSKMREPARDAAGKGCVKLSPKAMPSTSASGGEAHGVRVNSRSAKKIMRAGILDARLQNTWAIQIRLPVRGEN